MSNWETASTLQASAAQTATGAGAAVDLGTRDRLLRQTLSVTVVTGSTPSLTVRLEASADGATGWRTFGTFTAASATGTEKLSFVAPERYVRAAWTIAGGGPPSFTFSVAGTKGVSYANLDQLEGLGIAAASLQSVSVSKKAEQLAASTEFAAGILAARYTLPIEAWGNDLALNVCKLAVYELLSVRGLNPDGDDSNVRKRYDDAMKWLADVAAGKINPIGLVESTMPAETDDAIFIATEGKRGW